MSKQIKALIVIIYIMLWFITYSGCFAYFQTEYRAIAKENYRDDMAFSMGVAIFQPFAFVAVSFYTGFYEHGFKVK